MICTKCRIDRTEEEFPDDSRNRSGKASWCKNCYRERNRNRVVDPATKAHGDRRHYQKHHAKIREQQIDSRLRHRYGISKDQYDQMVADQEGRCLICDLVPTRTDNKLTLHVDHDHSTGVVRGLLCTGCNVKLGMLENLDWVEKAQRYLDATWIRSQ